VLPMTWEQLQPLLQEFWRQACDKLSVRSAPGRLKQWLALLSQAYPQALLLFGVLRRETDCARIDALLGMPAPADLDSAHR